MGDINREDMLELTRRMTLKRHCISRIAGAYLDEEGLVDGTFHRHFQKLSSRDQQINLELAKAIPFSETNTELREYCFSAEEETPGSVWQLLMALRACEMKNDAMLDVFYEIMGKTVQSRAPYAVYMFFGNYDVPLLGSDRESQWESEEVYSFLICAVCPVNGEYESGEPTCGFLFPAFKDRSTDIQRINLFQKAGRSPCGIEAVFGWRGKPNYREEI